MPTWTPSSTGKVADMLRLSVLGHRRRGLLESSLSFPTRHAAVGDGIGIVRSETGEELIPVDRELGDMAVPQIDDAVAESSDSSTRLLSRIRLMLDDGLVDHHRNPDLSTVSWLCWGPPSAANFAIPGTSMLKPRLRLHMHWRSVSVLTFRASPRSEPSLSKLSKGHAERSAANPSPCSRCSHRRAS